MKKAIAIFTVAILATSCVENGVNTELETTTVDSTEMVEVDSVAVESTTVDSTEVVLPAAN